ncbi:GDSL esterase/lipase EXL2 [Hibiscus syriacus]|uniref:GDSL esterase/lipase EXL2 n=1 Tax=Hibiscus syriacus TaxID=106335 RepID=A0A6A3BVL9_HIBSY|nr:GDSL esterase/lipase EXL3-like [Hibiscus syriacus]KAE8720694.1 GDSL esterase/lipase EXL2 [Hibiscus syriacus]
MKLSILSSFKGFLLPYLLVFVLLNSVEALVKLPPNLTVPAVIAFGDSIVDAGNNNNLRTLVKCNFPPYGKDFHGGVPTGRFCNGKIPSDLVAEELGIKETVPAYLDPTLTPQDLKTGVTFASGGAGYDPLTSKLVSVIPLSEQLDHFREYIWKLRSYVGEEETTFILSKSLFLVVAGSDDIANTYFLLRVRKLQYDVPSYTDLMANSALDFLKELYGLGARRIGVFSAPPIGCLPSLRSLAAGIGMGCAEDDNFAAKLFNEKLYAVVDSLQANQSDGKFVYIDVYNPLLEILQNPNKYGFEVANRGCCGTGNVEVAVLCNQMIESTCGNASEYVFWDSYHPTEKAYRALVRPLLQKYVTKFL